MVSDHANDVEGLIVDLEAAILKTDDIMYETFVLDTGCSSMLCGVGVHSLLQNARHSAVRIRGFNGSQRVPGVQHGRLHMYAMSADRSFTGSAVDFGVDTVENLNHNLFSLTEAFEAQGFDVHLTHTGFSGLSKVEANGDVTRVPAHYDVDTHQWLIHVAIGNDAHSVTRAGEDAERMLLDYIECHAACHTVFYSQEDAIVEMLSRRGVINLRDEDHLESIDMDALISAFDDYQELVTMLHRAYTSPTVMDSTVANVEAMYNNAAETVEDKLAALDNAVGDTRTGHARGRHTTSLQWHSDHGHVGHRDDCDICRTVKASLRRAYKTLEPHKETRPGYTWSADTITWSARSRHGNKYTTVFYDHCSGYKRLIHSCYRSDLTGQIEELVLSLRAHPLMTEGKDYQIMTVLHLDLAGEWGPENKAWNEMCTRVGLVVHYSTPDDKRSLKETAVKIIELGTKTIMTERMLPIDWWQEAADQACELRNYQPLSKSVVSSDGDAIRPLEEITLGRVSRKECDRLLHYFITVGTPALVTDNSQTPTSNNVEHLPRSRWGIAVRMIGELPVFMDPHTGTTFKSKSYRTFTMRPGESAFSFCGATVPPLPVTAHRRPQDDTEDMDRVIDLESFALVRKDDDDGDCAPFQPVTVADRDMQVYAPGADGFFRKEDIDTEPILPIEDSPADAEISVAHNLDMLDKNPKFFIGRDIFKRFKGHGVYHGVVTETKSDNNSQRWHIAYDDGDDEWFTADDMTKYCINFTDGDTEISDVNSSGGADLIGDHPVFITTKDNQSFQSVCTDMGIDPSQHRLYYKWIGEQFSIGHAHKKTPGGHHFVNPFGSAKSKSRFKPDTRFPIPQGESWNLIIEAHREESNLANDEYINAYIAETEMLMHLNEVYLKEKLIREHENADEVFAQLAQKLVPDDIYHPEHPQFDQSLLDKQTGRLLPPKSITEARGRSDWIAWETALKSELKSFDDLGVIAHGLTLKELRAMGYDQTPVPLIVVADAKYDASGGWQKRKIRICAQGHGGNVQRGVHYFNTFAAAPNTTTTRTLQALSVKHNLVSICFDVSTAYLWGDMLDEEKIPVQYPKGMRENHPETGEQLYGLLEKPLYGMPFSARRWGITRDRWVIETFNTDGWTCKKSREDPCLFTFTSPAGKRVWMIVHTDDVDLYCEQAEDGAEIADKFDKRFKIKMCSNAFMLGVKREHRYDEKSEVRSVHLTQPAFIEDLYNAYRDHLPSRTPTTPFPENEFLSLSKRKDDGSVERIDPPADEIRNVMALGYQSVVGGLLWAARNCHPEIAVGVNQMQRVMSKPTMAAWKSAMHCVSYLHSVKDRGIAFHSNGNTELRTYYDSSNRGDDTDEKSQYGFVICLFNGPVTWTSKKARHVGTSSTHNEYMAMFHACVDTVWLKRLLLEIGFIEEAPGAVCVLGDNDQATRLGLEDMVTTGNKMIRNNYHFVKECVELGDIDIRRVPTELNPADPLTKPLSRQHCERLLPVLTGTGNHLPDLPAPARL